MSEIEKDISQNYMKKGKQGKQSMMMRKTVAIVLSFVLAAGVIWGGLYMKSYDRTIPAASTKAISEEKFENADMKNLAMEYLEVIGTRLTDRNAGENEDENQHDKAKEWIISQLKEAGYSDDAIKTSDFDLDKNAHGTNIEVILPGRDNARQVIAGAHYDGDGVGDNGSGIALLLAEAVGMKKMTPAFTTKFVFFDAEEIGELGSQDYVGKMTDEEIKNTLYMVNIDSVAFGDYCNIYGGTAMPLIPESLGLSPYRYAVERAKTAGLKVMDTKDLDGYYAAHGAGPEILENTLYTNPWTKKNPSPENFNYPSPTTGDWGDHASFVSKKIPYLYLEATNWYAKGDGGSEAYTGYFDTDNINIGKKGMFMNTKYDTLENLDQYFSGRAEKHFSIYAKLLTCMLLG